MSDLSLYWANRSGFDKVLYHIKLDLCSPLCEAIVLLDSAFGHARLEAVGSIGDTVLGDCPQHLLIKRFQALDSTVCSLADYWLNGLQHLERRLETDGSRRDSVLPSVFMPKNIVLGCDGTDNDVTWNPTNMLRVFRMRAISSFRELGERPFLRGLTGEFARRTIKVVNLGRDFRPWRRSLRWMASKRLI